MTRNTLITDDPAQAARILRGGGLVAFPTETVFGLGADARDGSAVRAVYAAKGRPADNPLIVHIADAEDLGSVAAEVPSCARQLLDAFAPGPVTVVVPRGPLLAPAVSAGLETVAVRIPAHETALAMIRAAGVPVAAPSANRSGRPSATTWQAVVEELDGRVDAVLRGERSAVGLESTVIDCTAGPPAVLRAGGVSLEELRRVLPDIRAQGGRLQASPGTRHPHYAPAARVRVITQVSPEPERETAAWIGVGSAPAGYALVCSAASPEAYAHELYDFFRRADAAGVTVIHCQAPGEHGLGRALLDRIRRAEAAHRD